MSYHARKSPTLFGGSDYKCSVCGHRSGTPQSVIDHARWTIHQRFSDDPNPKRIKNIKAHREYAKLRGIYSIWEDA